VIDGDTPCLTRSELKKMGWRASDTALLHFDNCRVPAANLIGVENQGFKAIMSNFNGERLGIAVMAYSYAQVCLDEAVAWARERKTFGMPLAERQVIRHKLVDMAMRIDASRTLAYELAHCVQNAIGEPNQLVARICMLKNLATQTMQFCANESVQILGGMGFMRGTQSERIYREVKVL
jgi:acyl-CoA dehydrogenase